jgi:hypothetical protein
MKRSPLKRESSRHRERRLNYEHKKAVWLKEHPGCQYEFLGNYDKPIGVICNKTFMAGIHHKMGRGKYLDDERYFMTLCPIHHKFVEDNKNLSRRRGYILY